MRKQTYLLISILVLAFAVRLYKIDSPIGDWHSWRQADTAAVTRNFDRLGFTPLVPRFDDLSNVPSGIDNPEGYRMVEFPLYNIASFGIYRVFGWIGGTFEMWMRLTSVFASLGSVLFIYLIGKKYANERVGLIAAFFYSIIPYGVYYSRVVLPEPSLVFSSLGMIWFYGKFVEQTANSPDVHSVQSGSRSKHRDKQLTAKRRLVLYYLLAVLFGISALLIKPVAGFLFLPMAYLWYRQKNFTMQSIILSISYFAVVLAPLYLWRQWIQQFPEGIPAWRWLLNSNGIRFRPSFFYWMGWKRLTELILGYSGMIILIAGGIALLKHKLKSRWFFIWWVVAILLYVTVFATGNIQHDYYQVIAVPIVVLVMGLGVDYLLSIVTKKEYRAIVMVGLVLASVGMVYFSWQIIKGFYWINVPVMIEAGQEADRILPKDAKVIAPLGGDTAFLYQTNRQGWPVGISITDMIEKGATHYVNFNIGDAEVDYVTEAFTPILITDKYVIVELQ